MRIALATVPYPETPEDAVAHVIRWVTEAAQKGAAVVAFPEAYVPGYRGLGRNPGIVPSAFLDRAWRTIAEKAAAAGIAVVLGTERHIAGGLRLTALVIGSD